MSYQKLSIIEPEPTASTIILGGALVAMLGVALVLIFAFVDSTLLRWMCGCWR